MDCTGVANDVKDLTESCPVCQLDQMVKYWQGKEENDK